MRNKKRIELLELQLEYLSQYVDIISNSLLELLEREDERNEKPNDMDSGKWYKNS